MRPEDKETEDTMFLFIKAAMLDAAHERKMTQFKATVSPPGRPRTFVRILVVPETMDFEQNEPIRRKP